MRRELANVRTAASSAAGAATARPWLLVSAAFVKTGGQDRANYALARYLARDRDVHLVSHRADRDLESAGRLTLHRAPRPFDRDLLGEPFLQRMGRGWASRLTDAHVVANGGNCAWPDVNWVHYVHAAYDDDDCDRSLPRQAKQQIARRLFLRDERRAITAARLVIANSRRTATDLVERLGVRHDRIRIVYYGVDPDVFKPASAAERLAIRSALGWRDDRPIVLFVGALGDRRKGFDTLFAAWRRLRKSSALDPRLVVVGRGAMLGEWAVRAAAEGLQSSIDFLGFRNDVPRLIRAADLLVAPTRYEAYGLGVHEALCCGVPAIVSADAGVAERYPDVLTPLLLPDADDRDDLTDRIATCLDRLDDLRARLAPVSASLRSRTWDDMARDIERAVTA